MLLELFFFNIIKGSKEGFHEVGSTIIKKGRILLFVINNSGRLCYVEMKWSILRLVGFVYMNQFETKYFCGYIKTLNGKSNWEMAMFLNEKRD